MKHFYLIKRFCLSQNRFFLWFWHFYTIGVNMLNIKKTFFVLMSLFIIIGIVPMINVYADVNSDIVAIETSEKARETILLEIKSSQDIDRMHNILDILIKETDSMDDDEREYWSNYLQVMNFQQRLKLLKILSTEKLKLAVLERKYIKELKNIITDSEDIKTIFSGKTIYWNKHAEYIRADGATFYNDKKMGLVTGTWFIKKENICYQYMYSDRTFCYKVSKKGKQIFLNDQLITFKSGDTESLQELVQVGLIVTETEEIKRLFSEKTMYLNDDTEYTRADGITFYNRKKKELLTGKWFVKKASVCYQYTGFDKTSCHKVFKKGTQIFINGNFITLKSGDTENLQEVFLLKSVK